MSCADSASSSPSLFDSVSHNTQLFLLTAMAGLIVYGYPLSHFSLPIDGEFPDNFQQTIALGRWGHSLLRAWLLPEPFVPFFTLLVAILALSLAALLAARLLALTGLPALVFCTLMVGFPQMAYQFEFINQADTVAIGYLLAIASTWLFCDRSRQGIARWGLLLLSVGCYAYAIGIYQTLVVVPPLMLLGKLLFDSDTRGPLPGTVIARLIGFAMVSVAAIVLYSLVTHWTQSYYQKSNVGYLATFMNLDLSLAAYLQAVTRQVALGVAGLQNYGLTSFSLATLAAALTIGLSLGKTRPRSLGLYRAALAAAILLLPFVLCLTSRYALPPRVLVATNLAFPLLAVYALRRFNPRWLTSIGVALLVLHSGWVSQLFASDAAVRHADVLMANRIATVLYTNYPDFDPANTPVYFHGGIPNDSMHKLPKSDVFGSSFFAWDGGNNFRLRHFFRYYGIGDWHNADKTQTERALAHVDAMPRWPNPGAIQRHDGVMIVKLGEHRGWLPFAVD